MATNLEKEYLALQKTLKISNVYAVPKVERISVNVGVGKQRDDKSFLKTVVHDVAAITGQHPHERKARAAVAGFKVREGNLVGYHVTLRGKRMEDFMKRFVDITLPRVRDFRGVAVSQLDGQGNLSVGLTEQLSFAEIDPEKTNNLFGVQVTFVTSANNNEDGLALFKALGFPMTDVKNDIDESEIVQGKGKSELNKS